MAGVVWDVDDDMQAAPARRFHEAGLGSRTGLRSGSVRLDEQGQEDLDAFFAESKRVLECCLLYTSDAADDTINV